MVATKGIEFKDRRLGFGQGWRLRRALERLDRVYATVFTRHDIRQPHFDYFFGHGAAA